MTRVTFYSALLAIVLGLLSCDQPNPIELLREETPEPAEVSLLVGAKDDTLIVSEPNFDFTGLTPQEEEIFPATIIVNGIKSDFGGASTLYSYSRVVLKDKNSPVQVTGRFGRYAYYPHLDVGVVRLNGTVLDRSEVVIQIRSLTVLPIKAGILYRLVNEGNAQSNPFYFRANSNYAIQSEGKAQIEASLHNLTSPDEITITAPKANSLHFRDEDMVVRWEGKPGRELLILISIYDEVSQRPGKPLMLVKVPQSSKSVLLPAKLLRIIPQTSGGKFVFSLISANRAETQIVGYSGRVLTQSASIHNVGVTLK